MNIRNIQPITIWSPEGQQAVSKLQLLTFYGYQFNDGPGYVDYQLLDSNNIMQFAATLIIPSNIVQQWGASDDIIWQYVSNTLGLIITI
jgi:hypothetical protein